MISCGEFQSTPSAWRETVQLLHLDMSVIFQSTPSAWRETHAIVRVDAPNYISIHSLRMEGDCRSPIAALRILHFNPLPPHGGRLCDLVLFSPLYISFQSTPSAWRETRSPVLSLDLDPISIHSLRMEGDDRLSITTICRICISIHSLRMEGD